MSSPTSSDQIPRKETGKQPLLTVPLNTFSNITAGDDSRQLIVSTEGIAIQAADITAANRTAQAMGQMADESIQTFFPSDIAANSGEPQGKNAKESSWWHYGDGRTVKSHGN
ncbi:hypothetical protein BKA63DRAFT_527184 [Paraphoma chrysanthemicola]|nr:hypothetical protein BKA63DRAFT_527184 [Paraphoma chrysanthemicola]